MRHATISIAVASTLVGLCGGCSIVGKWSLSSVDPTAAQRDFEFQSLTLQKDGTFYAEEQERGIKTASGIYRYDAAEQVLALDCHDGEKHTYEAKLGGNTLRLEQLWKGQKVKADFVRKE